MDERNEIEAIKSWAVYALNIHGQELPEPFGVIISVETYFTAFQGKYFTGDGALRDEVGYYRITGRVDDVVIVSGHNLGNRSIEDAINHPAVAESAIVGFPRHKGMHYMLCCYSKRNRRNLIEKSNQEINQQVSNQIGPIAKLDKIQFVSGLPKTRSGKIMRRILRKMKVIILILETPPLY
jgi:acetyl-CoA synthetase